MSRDNNLSGTRIARRDILPSSSQYELLVRIASGGMATVYVGRLSAARGVSRLVAIKRAHAHLVETRELREALVLEARLASMIHHPHVVAVQNVEEHDDELLLVMDYVEGASLSELNKRGIDAELPMPPAIAVRILLDACEGLHATHVLRGTDGAPLHLVHRDVSPHNILVGCDGMARITDFGIAKSIAGGAATATGVVKGKIGYIAPEYMLGKPVDARADVFALGVVAWEALSRSRLFTGDNEVLVIQSMLASDAPLVSTEAPWLGTHFDKVLARALARKPEQRLESMRKFGQELEAAARQKTGVASHSEVAQYVERLMAPLLEARRTIVHERASEPNIADPDSTETTVDRSEDEVRWQTASMPQAAAADTLPTRVEPRTAPSAQTVASIRAARRGNLVPIVAVVVIGVATLVTGIVIGSRMSRSPSNPPVVATEPATATAAQTAAEVAAVPSSGAATVQEAFSAPDEAPQVASPRSSSRSLAPRSNVREPGREAPPKVPPNPYEKRR